MTEPLRAVLKCLLLSAVWLPAAVLADAPAAPSIVPGANISAGDTAWMLTATVLVLLMTIPGLALFYAKRLSGA